MPSARMADPALPEGGRGPWPRGGAEPATCLGKQTSADSALREHHAPVMADARNTPAAFPSDVECASEPADLAVPVVAVLPHIVVVVHEQHETRRADVRVLQHLHITVGVAEREDRTLANMEVDVHGLTGAVVDAA